ncbi:MAG: nickel transporter, permease protein [Rhizobium sp.]|nr:nickel transporter, permease protein [Rhizobium sp.]
MRQDVSDNLLSSSGYPPLACRASPPVWGRCPAGQRGVFWKAVLSVMLLLTTATLAHANSSLGIGNNEPGAGPPSPFVMEHMPWLAPLLFYIAAMQQEFYRALTTALKGMRTDVWQLWSLVGVSFVYGIFHAAGPGHGKAVISSYMIANETELKRGVLISFMSAFLQGATAILVTGAGFLVLRGTTFTMTDAAKWLEVLSFTAIMAFGLYLLYRKTRGMLRRPVLNFAGPELALAGGGHHDHHEDDHQGHDHHHHHSHHGHLHHHGHDHSHAQHFHAHSGEVCEVCGHSHAPTPDLVAGETFSLADAWSAIVAVGMRPCSGAIFVLTFSFLNGLYLGGILSVVAMSFGTAITVSVLATLAVTAKDFALRFAGSGSGSMRIANTIEILGAVCVTLFGFTFLMASLQA